MTNRGRQKDTRTTAIGIVRVSSKKQKDNNSPGVQRSGIEAYAQSRALQLLRVEEVHESAKSSKNRTAFHKVIETARAEGVENLIFWVWDRTTRNFTDFEVMEDDIRSGHFALHTAYDRKVLNQGSAESEWMAAGFCHRPG